MFADGAVLYKLNVFTVNLIQGGADQCLTAGSILQLCRRFLNG